jgi:putative tryptophan/tyrosine transport system substrate-binding protein
MRDAGMQVLPLIARPGEPLEPIFENLTGKRVDALLIQGSIARKEMLDLAIQHRLPVLTSIRLGPSLGALMSYGSDYFALARQSAVYIDKILKGEKPVAQASRQVWSADFNLPNELGLQPAYHPHASSQRVDS